MHTSITWFCALVAVAAAVDHFESGVKEVDIKLSVCGGERGTGPKRQKAEITAYTLRNGAVRAVKEEENLYTAIDLATDKVSHHRRSALLNCFRKVCDFTGLIAQCRALARVSSLLR